MTGVSFVIITSGTTDDVLAQAVASIDAENIPEYEIVIVGGDKTTITSPSVRHIPFDENQKSHVTVLGLPGRWITRKINLGIESSKYEIVVSMRDYIKLLPGWYKGFKEYGFDWDICLHQGLLKSGVRGNGWRIFRYPGLPPFCMIPYDIDHYVKYMPMPGCYWVAKKSVMLKYPLNENLLWGEEEDAEWSRRVVPNCNIKCNSNCVTQYLKDKPDDANHAVDVATMNGLASHWDAIRNLQIKNLILSREK